MYRTHDYYAALVLVSASQILISKRREMEAMCGYPPEYGNDELLLKRIDEFMADETIRHELIEAKEFAQRLKEKK